MTIGFVFWVHGEHERYAPFDEYKVLSILPNPKRPSYAAVVRHYHANSSATVIDVWIGDNPPPEVGSTERLHGWPVFIAPDSDVDLAWRDGRLIAKVPAPVEIAGGDSACLFNYDGIQGDIACANLDKVDVLVTR